MAVGLVVVGLLEMEAFPLSIERKSKRIEKLDLDKIAFTLIKGHKTTVLSGNSEIWTIEKINEIIDFINKMEIESK